MRRAAAVPEKGKVTGTVRYTGLIFSISVQIS